MKQWSQPEMAEMDLLRSLPKTKRNIQARTLAKTPERIAASLEFGETYFDGPREFGYGGYRTPSAGR